MEIMTREAALRKLQRMAYEIVESNFGENEIILAGIKENGLIIAGILSGFLKSIFAGKITILGIEINKKDPVHVSLDSGKADAELNNKIIIITDDVANSGRTLSYSLRPFLDYYPSKIQTLVLVERSYKKFPVTPDYKGLSIATALSERIVVETLNGEVLGARIENE